MQYHTDQAQKADEWNTAHPDGPPREPDPYWGPNWAGQLLEAEAELAAARRLLDDALEMRDRAARGCADAIGEAIHDDLRNETGFWHAITQSAAWVMEHAPFAAVGFMQEDGGTTPGDKYHIGPPSPPHLTFDDDFPYDPNAKAGFGDYWSWNEWGLKAKGARLTRSDLDDALDAYAHYRDATGSDHRIDYEEAYREDGGVRNTVDGEVRSAQEWAEKLYQRTGQTSFEMSGNPTEAKAHNGGGYATDTENWQKTLGDYTVWSDGKVTVQGDTMTMKVVVHAEDRYDFNKDAADIASGASDNENGRFSTLGWAKGFRTHGEVERTVTWKIGDAPHSTETAPHGDGDRNRGGEDRSDRL